MEIYFTLVSNLVGTSEMWDLHIHCQVLINTPYEYECIFYLEAVNMFCFSVVTILTL